MIRRPDLPADRYAIVPNDWARDNRLTFKAIGLLTYLMSHAPGWTVTIESLAERGPDGRDGIRAAIKELEEAGYLTRERGRDDAGRLAGMDYVLADPFAPATDYPTQGLPNVGESTPYKKNMNTEDKTSEEPELQPRGRATNEQLAYLRDLYKDSGRWPTDDVEAEWRALTITEADSAIRRLKRERRRHEPTSPLLRKTADEF
jgi:hypothetical protein